MEPDGRSTATAALSPDSPLVELGPIVNTHGLLGEVRLLPHNPESTTAAQPGPVVLVHRDGRREPRTVRAARRHKRFVLLTFAGVADATAATALVGCAVAVPRTALPPAGPDTFYHADLLGCAVVTTDGRALGAVAQMMFAGSSDICVVRDGAREVLVPMIADVVDSIDLAGRRLVIRAVPGLLDEA